MYGCYQFTTGDTTYYDVILAEALGDAREISFSVRAGNNAHIAFFSPSKSSEGVYEIVLGSQNNSQSIIRQSDQGPYEVIASTPNIVSPHEHRKFWADAKNGVVRVGAGSTIGSNLIMEWNDTKPHIVTYVGFRTGPGSSGTWNVCIKGKANQAYRYAEWK